MNKLFTKIAALVLGMTMAVGVGVAVGSGAKASEVDAASPASKSSFDAISGDIDTVISYASYKGGGTTAPAVNTNAIRLYQGDSTNAGGLLVVKAASGYTMTSITVGSTMATSVGYVAGQEYTTTQTQATMKANGNNKSISANGTATFSGLNDSVVTFACLGTSKTSRWYLSSISVTYSGSSGKTVTSLEVLDESANELKDGDEVNATLASGNEYATSEVTCEVSYSTSDHDGDVTFTSNPSTGFSYSTEDDSTYTFTFANNGDYDVKIASTLDESFAITVTYHVSGIVVVVYEKVTSVSSLKSGSQFIIGKSDGTYVLGQYSGSGNNCPALSVTPLDSDTISASAIPSGYALFTLGGTSGSWTLTDQDDGVYYGTNGENYLKSSKTASDTWSISIEDGIATITSKASSRVIKKNQNSALFSTYTSGQHTVSIYMIPSTDPAIEVEVTGETTLSVGETATLTATKINGATGTVTWSANNSHVTLSATTGDSITVTGATDGSTDVTASLTGGSTVTPVVTTFTVEKALQSIAVTTEPTKTTYTEGESFDNAGMVVTATYDDASTENPTDYTWTPSGALTPSITEITISWGGKTTTQAITVKAKEVSSIVVKTNPTKSSYHSGDEFDSTGLVITVNYEGGTSSDITEGFEISPSEYTFTTEDETAGSKTFTVTYSGKSTTFDVEVAAISGPIASGRYYIMNSGKTYGLNAAQSTSSPTAINLSVSNELTAFDVTLTADNEYEISTTVESTKYYLACTTTAASGSNTSIKINSSSTTSRWHLSDEDVETTGAYHTYTVPGSVNRYLSCYNESDWRGYASLSYGDPELQFVPEGSYANEIAEAIMSNESPLCDGGVTAPSVSRWNEIAGITKIENELAILRNTEAAPKDEHGETPTGTTAEKAMARYDEIMVSYNTQTSTVYVDFLGRISAQNLPIKASTNIFFGINDSNNAIAIVVIVSVVSLTAIGGYFFLRKKREQN